MVDYVKRKSPFLAAVLSFLIPGLGQAYDGKILKGAIFFIGYIILWGVITAVYLFGGIITAMFTAGFGLLCWLPIFFIPLIVNLWAAYDAHKIAERINMGIYY
ncbi:hypothetical protein CUJ83_09490 [Methanocella sp. CWC-04]|uniref:TM2 domain-containing protein n=1 Tax=Methanooceanicella nereidis TaxID=2052831 RepID=A0AAP2W585_9EURY|nr:hypothetical protein [Methanocella sp. CWC-04]MCD1295230.1 hypothetical protein [Methanocella sp. CWC-04]